MIGVIATYNEKAPDMTQPTETGRPWSPYWAGALAGLLIIASVWVAGKYLGASTTFVKSAGIIEKALGSQRVAKMAYFMKEVPSIDWQWMFVVGIFLGSLAASIGDRSFKLQATPDMWQDRFGPGKGKRWLTAFGGGVIAMYGARLADG